MILDYAIRAAFHTEKMLKTATILARKAFDFVRFLPVFHKREQWVRNQFQNNDIGLPAAVAVLGVVIAYNILVPLPTLSGYTAYAPSPDSEAYANPNAQLPSVEPANWEVQKSYLSQVTVYNSVPEQTQGDPFVTASGERVRDGIVAANCLPFGTKLRMPDMYGDKIFVVKDRLAADKSCYILDIWQEWTPDAKSFGAPTTKIEIIERGA